MKRTCAFKYALKEQELISRYRNSSFTKNVSVKNIFTITKWPWKYENINADLIFQQVQQYGVTRLL